MEMQRCQWRAEGKRAARKAFALILSSVGLTCPDICPGSTLRLEGIGGLIARSRGRREIKGKQTCTADSRFEDDWAQWAGSDLGQQELRVSSCRVQLRRSS